MLAIKRTLTLGFNLTAGSLATLLLLATSPFVPGAQLTAHWIGGTDGDWSNPANWDTGRIPNNANGDVFDVIWDAHPVTINLDRTVTIRNFTFAQAGQLTGVGTMTIEGDFDWRAGTLAGNGPAIQATGTAELGTGVVLGGFRELILAGKSQLLGKLELQGTAQLTISATGQLDLLDGASVRTDNSRTFFIINSGTVRILPSATTVTLETYFRNNGLLAIYAQEVLFNVTCEQRAGRMEVYGSTILTPGSVQIAGGELTGRGFISKAFISDRISGQFKFDFLELQAGAKVSLLIRGRNDFDQLSADTINLQMPTLEVNVANNAKRTIQTCDQFGILNAKSQFGNLTNTTFGARFSVADGSGSFLIESQSINASSSSIVLRDWLDNVANDSSCVHFSEAATTYPLKGTLVLDPTAAVTASSGVDWQGSSVFVRMSEVFSPNVDAVEIQRGTNATGQIGLRPIDSQTSAISFNGVEFALADFQGPKLTVTCTGSTSSQALQSLFQSLAFRNSTFSPLAAAVYDFPTREIELTLTTPAAKVIGFKKQIQFPHFSGTLSQSTMFSLRTMMNESPEGSQLLGTFLPHTAEIAGLMATNTALAQDLHAVGTNFQQVVTAVLAGDANAVRITPTQINQLDTAWDHLASVASPALQFTLLNVRADIGGFQQFVGQTVAQSAGDLGIPVPQQPVFYAFRPRFRDGQFSVQANLIAGLQYFLWRAFEIKAAPWQPVTNAAVAFDGSTLTFTDTNSPALRSFYRVSAKGKSPP
ncbi:MAG: hypothetical protein HY043_10530 [Verrucomicrobia bacterium]|nr:hypothetical protein [Verrucomicrobiota bacterium]